MNIALWVVQGWLAAIFFAVGMMKLLTPRVELQKKQGMGYVEERSGAEMKLIGLAEVLGAIGLILPWLLQVVPVLTPLAATMVGAIITHRRRKEPALVPAVLLVLALFVAFGRFGILD